MSSRRSRFLFTFRRCGEVVSSGIAYNKATREAMEHFAGILFGGSLPGSLVYKFGLIDEEDYVDIDVEDTLVSHAGWKEITDYTRVDWPKGSVVSGGGTDSVTNLVDEYGTWEFTTTGTFRGFFVTNNDVLLSTAPLAEGRKFYPGDTLEVTYTFILSS